MSVEKLNEDRHSLEPKNYDKQKLLELKKAMIKSERELNLGEDLAKFLSYFFDKISEGKKISIIEETELWNITKTAKFLGVTRPTVYKMLKNGDLVSGDAEDNKIYPASVTAFMIKKEVARNKALKAMHEIDKKLKKQTRDLISEVDSSDGFEEIDL